VSQLKTKMVLGGRTFRGQTKHISPKEGLSQVLRGGIVSSGPRVVQNGKKQRKTDLCERGKTLKEAKKKKKMDYADPKDVDSI